MQVHQPHVGGALHKKPDDALNHVGLHVQVAGQLPCYQLVIGDVAPREREDVCAQVEFTKAPILSKLLQRKAGAFHRVAELSDRHHQVRHRVSFILSRGTRPAHSTPYFLLYTHVEAFSEPYAGGVDGICFGVLNGGGYDSDVVSFGDCRGILQAENGHATGVEHDAVGGGIG